MMIARTLEHPFHNESFWLRNIFMRYNAVNICHIRKRAYQRIQRYISGFALTRFIREANAVTYHISSMRWRIHQPLNISVMRLTPANAMLTILSIK